MANHQKFILSAGGIFVCFFLFGLMQEKVTKTQYVNADGSVEYFTYSMTLVLIYCAVNSVLSMILISILKQEDSTPRLYYYISSVMYLLAMVCSNLALQFVSYPTQVVAKSCKPIPVMVLGVFLGKKSYSYKKYLFVMLVVVGVILFLFKDKKDDKAESNEGFGMGELLIICSLFMDGLYAALQERMRGEHQTKPLHMMAQLNKWGAIYLFVIWFFTKEAFKFASFVQRQPSVIFKLGALSLCGFLGQFCVISMVVEFGTLPATIITTIRKFFTVLVSVLLLGNHLLPRQWLGTMIIFTGLFLDIFYGKSDTKHK